MPCDAHAIRREGLEDEIREEHTRRFLGLEMCIYIQPRCGEIANFHHHHQQQQLQLQQPTTPNYKIISSSELYH